MRLKLLTLVLVASLAGGSAALAKNGKSPHNGGCHGKVMVVLKGTLAPDVDPQDGDTSFVLTVLHSNRHGRAWKAAGSATVLVGDHTRVNRQGAHNLGALAPSDRVHVKAKVCKADLANGGMPDLNARKIDAHPPATGE
jgi:hypothetical protein